MVVYAILYRILGNITYETGVEYRRYFRLMTDTFEEHSWLFEELPILQIFKEYETMGIIGPMIYSIQYLAQASKSRMFRL